MVGRGGGKRLAVAFFEPSVAAQAVACLLTRHTRAGVPEGCIGVLTLDPRGQLIAHSGRPYGGHGVGVLLGVLALALGARVAPAPGPLLGGSDLSTDDLARFAAELEAGQALVAVLDRRRRAERAVVRLTALGGRVELHRITGRALQRAAAMSAGPAPTPAGS
jgi:hypothetical protein